MKMLTRRDLLEFNLCLLKDSLYSDERYRILLNEFQESLTIYPKTKVINWLYKYNDRYEDFPVNKICTETGLLEVSQDIYLRKITEEINSL